MTGLSLEVRYALVRECERYALQSLRIPGTRRLALTPADCRVLRALCFDFHNGRTGRTDPGYRAIAKAARVGLGTVGAALRRLRAAGFLRWTRRLLRVLGRVLRWMHCYDLAPGPRSMFAAEPREERKEERLRRPPPPVPDPGRDLLAERRAVMEARWRAVQSTLPRQAQESARVGATAGKGR